jgi:hypothetical protein
MRPTQRKEWRECREADESLLRSRHSVRSESDTEKEQVKETNKENEDTDARIGLSDSYGRASIGSGHGSHECMCRGRCRSHIAGDCLGEESARGDCDTRTTGRSLKRVNEAQRLATRELKEQLSARGGQKGGGGRRRPRRGDEGGDDDGLEQMLEKESKEGHQGGSAVVGAEPCPTNVDLAVKTIAKSRDENRCGDTIQVNHNRITSLTSEVAAATTVNIL